MAKKLRNEQILELRKQGMAMADIGRAFGITRERARQIIYHLIGKNKYIIPKKLAYERIIFDATKCQLCNSLESLSVVIVNIHKDLTFDNIATVCQLHKDLVLKEHYKEYPPTIAIRKKEYEQKCRECGQIMTKSLKRFCSDQCKLFHRVPYLKTGIKKCFSCKIDKKIEEYYRNTSSKSGLQSYCKPCFNAKTKPYAKRHNSSEAGKAYFKRYAEQNRERLEAQRLARYRANPEYYRERFKRYYYEHIKKK